MKDTPVLGESQSANNATFRAVYPVLARQARLFSFAEFPDACASKD